MNSSPAVCAALICLTLGLVLIASCISSQQNNAEVRSAVEALDKIRAATEVGTSIDAYLNLVLEARVKVDLATATLTDEALRQDLALALQCYQDAATAWSYASNGDSLNKEREPGLSLHRKYHLPVDGAGNVTDIELARQAAWAKANSIVINLSATAVR